MKSNSTSIKKILLGLTMLLLLLPAIQHLTNIPRLRALRGDIRKVAPVTLTWKNWFTGEYGQSTNEYFTHNMGFRPNLVRLDNQLAYSLFGETRAKNVVVGKEDYLYEKNYIDAYTGRDFIGETAIQDKVQKLKLIQDSLAALDKHLLIVLAVGKASYFPEYIPDEMMLQTDSTNYNFYLKALKEYGVNHIDFMTWFIQQKGKSPYPLYPKTGIHWSEYGMALAADSLIQRVEQMNEAWDLPELYWDTVAYVNERREIDDDIEQALNLIYPFDNIEMAYPKYQFNTKDKDSLNVIMISDSFFWRMYNIGMMPKAFIGGQFWYYNNESYPQQFELESKVAELNLREEIEQVDVVVMMSTEGNLHKFPWGAEAQFYDFFKKGYEYDSVIYEQKVQTMVERIKADEKWFKSVKEKGLQRQISLDSMLRMDAIYMMNQAKK